MKKKILSIALTLTMVFTLCMIQVSAAGTTKTPTTWGNVQTTINGMSDGDILDLSSLPKTAGVDLTITKSIIVKGPGKDDADIYTNLYFVLSGTPTVTFENLEVQNTSAIKSVISGNGNIILDTVTLQCSKTLDYNPAPTINIVGNVTLKGTVADKGFPEGIGHTTFIAGATTNAANTVAGTAIVAVNVTIEGGYVGGGMTMQYPSQSGNAINASGNVTVSGSLVNIGGNYYDTTAIYGGGGDSSVVGGNAIIANGNVNINGGAVVGGDASAVDGIGGSGIIADGNIALSGERITQGTSNFYSCYVRPGTGKTIGISLKFTGDDNSASRTLTAKTVVITGKNKVSGGTAAPYTMQLQKNDIAIIDDSRIGWYSDLPVFSGGSYNITNPEKTWGTLTNATAIKNMDETTRSDGTNINANAVQLDPTYIVIIPESINFGDLTRMDASATDSAAIVKQSFHVTVTNIANLFDQQISVKVTNLSFKLMSGAAVLPFSVYSGTNTTVLGTNSVFTSFTANRSQDGAVKIDQRQITAAGSYSGTLNFAISVENVAP